MPLGGDASQHVRFRGAIYGLALLVSAFLLFVMQPMMARFFLPSFGGGSGVWSVCLLFFQGALLLGYLYSHLLSQWLSARHAAILHSALLLLSLAALPIDPAPDLANAASDMPGARLVWLLVRSVGLPCILISASAPLLQHWVAQGGSKSPYRLYAISNLGSLAGLLCYPALIEPLFGLPRQARFWSLGYLLLVLLGTACASYAFRLKRRTPHGPDSTEAQSDTRLAMLLLWLSLSCAGVILLLSITAELTSNMVPMPLLWVVPLALYLLSFIKCFASDDDYHRRFWFSLFCLLILPTLWLPATYALIGLWASVALSCACLFSGCMVCHGELARLRPPLRELSRYYLVLALGGVLGSAFVTFAAPVIFDRNWELAVALIAILGLAIFARQEISRLTMGVVVIWLIGIAAIAFIGTLPLRAQEGTVAEDRSFYGRLTVVDTRTDAGPLRFLVHGRTRHGAQYLAEGQTGVPTLYYSRESGIGFALGHYTKQEQLRIGVVGLGVGTLASYGRPGDEIRFYEIDPLVESFCRRFFSFLSDSKAKIEVVLGDGRLSLEREWDEAGGSAFDLLVVDAFNADAVPTHLLTREAFRLYDKHLDQGGTLALHITNRFLDLAPLIRAQAIALGKTPLLFRSEPNQKSNSGSTWVLISANKELLDEARTKELTSALPSKHVTLWTDNYSNILEALK